MPRYAALVEYNGRPFFGWQRQNDFISVQQVIEQALEKLMRYSIPVVGCGRTDTGVHATGQVIHFDLHDQTDPIRMRSAVNHYLGNFPVSLRHIALVQDDFHARFDAIQRGYRYKIINRRARLTFQDGLIWHIPVPLNFDAMEKAAVDFLGEHDFTTFRSVDCQAKGAIRTIEQCYFERLGEEIHFVVRARSFLQHQIRSMMGTLERIGAEKLPEDYIKTALQAKDRRICGRLAPPVGLYFEYVSFGKPIFHQDEGF